MARRQIRGTRMLITGASQGIGRALAEDAARRGARVLAVARSEPLLQELVQAVRSQGGFIEPIQADVTVPADRQKMVEASLQHFGGLDVLVNNAGIGATGHFVEAEPERLRQIMEVNFFGVTETTRAFLPLLRQGNCPAIVNISSIAGKRGIPARSEYSASKFAIQGFSEALRAELAKDGIDVLIVSPGLTQTNFSKNMLEQKARLQMDHMRGMTSEQVAAATLHAIERGHSETTLTFQGKLMAFVSRFLPRLADRIAARRVRALFQDEIAARQREKAAAPTPVREQRSTP
ncbi:short-chain dehydrogenase [Planctomycetaceae bacterium SCGC AG-212-D15]|nr:short-chain dehydrogenase [Planctomycetaceae bacterium SCGC AG-212-D15]